jgi:DNA (cytosine-5)-methyltransferase 1
MLTHLSLFSGIGGLDLAANWAGFSTVACCEIDPFCQKILAKHWPGVPIFPDIFKLNRKVLEEAGVLGDGRTITLISGGVPCQPASVAGQRRGAEDDRWLWPEAIRVISEVKPTWAVLENVGGLITLDGGMAFEHILSDLEGIGYEAQAFVIPACAVDAKHRRDRVWIVAHSGHEQPPERRELAEGLQYSGRWQARSEFAPCGNVANSQSRENIGRERGELAGSAGCGTGGNAATRSGSEDVGNSIGGGQRWLPRRRAGEVASDGHSGMEAGNVADAGSFDGGAWRAESEGQQRPPGTANGGDVADTDSRRCKQHRQQKQSKRSISQFEREGRRSFEPGLGEFTARVSRRLDGHIWPAGYGAEQYEFEPPRVATGVKNRVNRLKATGNSVNPYQAFPILAGIAMIERSR